MSLPQRPRFPWNLDWNLLRTFMVVVEQRGISKAATHLGLKQPTVSAALKRLEQAIGKTLVIRKPNEFTITRAGQVLYTECATIFGTVSQIPAILDEDNAELRGHLSIAITSSVISEHFDSILNRFAQAHPSVTYSFTVYESDEVETMIKLNRASFGICLLSSVPKSLMTMVLYREYFGLYCGARHSAVRGRGDQARGSGGGAFRGVPDGSRRWPSGGDLEAAGAAESVARLARRVVESERDPAHDHGQCGGLVRCRCTWRHRTWRRGTSGSCRPMTICRW
jgi:DNA-binding transcriptional LysR family regulator